MSLSLVEYAGRAMAHMGKTRKLRSQGSAYETNQFLIGIHNFPKQVDWLIAERRTLHERIASGDAEAVELLDQMPTTAMFVFELYKKAVALVPKNRRRTWGSGFHYGKVGRELKDGHPMFIIDRDIITTYYGIRTGALALQARGYHANWKGFRSALDKGMAADLAEEFDGIQAKRNAGDDTWHKDFYGSEHRLGYLMLTAPKKLDAYRALKLVNRDFLQYADMMVDYTASHIGEYLPFHNKWAVMNDLRQLHHLYRSTVDNQDIPAAIRDAFTAGFEEAALKISAKADVIVIHPDIADQMIQMFRRMREAPHVIPYPSHPNLVHQGVKTAASVQAKLLVLAYRFAQKRRGAEAAGPLPQPA
ncbi:MAG: hypothetical protein HY053_08420 [Proteobacteria bacterium]|nr:hypothetical protein [Pseudomonadota bacterium]